MDSGGSPIDNELTFIEVQPFLLDQRTKIFCEKVALQKISCTEGTQLYDGDCSGCAGEGYWYCRGDSSSISNKCIHPSDYSDYSDFQLECGDGGGLGINDVNDC
jgi:hypothetical protein